MTLAWWSCGAVGPIKPSSSPCCTSKDTSLIRYAVEADGDRAYRRMPLISAPGGQREDAGTSAEFRRLSASSGTTGTITAGL